MILIYLILDSVQEHNMLLPASPRPQIWFTSVGVCSAMRVSQFVFRARYRADTAYQMLWHTAVWEGVVFANHGARVYLTGKVFQLIREGTRVYFLTASLFSFQFLIAALYSRLLKRLVQLR